MSAKKMQQLINNHNEEIQTNNKSNKNSEEVQINGSSTRQSRNCETVFFYSSASIQIDST
jgi:hypothetical protein